MKTLWHILRTFIPRRNNPYVGLLFILGVFVVQPLRADTNAVTHKDYYFTYDATNGSHTVLVQLFLSPSVTGIATHTNNRATVIFRDALTEQDQFAQLTGWGSSNAMLAVNLPEYIPYVPPIPVFTPEQRLTLSNAYWLRNHPVTLATPKSGALKKVTIPVKVPRP